MAELDITLQRLAAVMDVHQVDAVHLRLASSFAWITGGKSSYINTASSTGLASVLITRTGRYALTTNIEAPRIAEEEEAKQPTRPFNWRTPPGLPPRG